MNKQEYEQLVREDPEIADYLEFNRGSWRNKPYWRSKPYHRSQPTPAQIKHRIAFIKQARSAYGKKSLTEVGGVMMPQACRSVQTGLQGKKFAETTTEEKRLQYTHSKINASRENQFETGIKKLKESLIEMGKTLDQRQK